MKEKEYQETPTGDYVNHPAYLEMRLRMKLTGTASPTEEAWVEALRALLDRLDAE